MPLTVAADAPVILGREHDIGEFARRPVAPLTTFPIRPEQAITTSVAGLRAALNRQSTCHAQTEAWVPSCPSSSQGKILSCAGRAILGLNHIIGLACLDGTTFPRLAAELHAAARASPVLRPQKSVLHGIKAVAFTGRQRPSRIAIDGASAAPASRHACASFSDLL